MKHLPCIVTMVALATATGCAKSDPASTQSATAASITKPEPEPATSKASAGPRNARALLEGFDGGLKLERAPTLKSAPESKDIKAKP